MKVLKIKYIYSEKAIKFCKISTLHLTGTTQEKSKMEISQNFVAFSEYMNFSLAQQQPGGATGAGGGVA